MRTAWYWPIYGEADEIAFTFAPSKARTHIEKTLLDFKGTLLTDGAAAYARYAIEHEDVVHAQCWAHTRRQFERALSDDPPGAHAAPELIGQLYTVETTIRKQQMEAVATQATSRFTCFAGGGCVLCLVAWATPAAGLITQPTVY